MRFDVRIGWEGPGEASKLGTFLNIQLRLAAPGRRPGHGGRLLLRYKLSTPRGVVAQLGERRVRNASDIGQRIERATNY